MLRCSEPLRSQFYVVWKNIFLDYRVVELTGDVTPDMRAIAQADLIVTTPEKWDGVSRSWQNRSYVQKVSILIIDEIHLLGEHSFLSCYFLPES